MKKKIIFSVMLLVMIIVACVALVGCDNNEVTVYLDYQLTDQYHSACSAKLNDLLFKPEDPIYENYKFIPGHSSTNNIKGINHKNKLTIDNPRMGEGYDANKNYLFIGWYKEPECIRPWNFSEDRVHGDTTIYAKWIEKTW